ncbi:MAG: hypothetical protein AAF735_07290 [Myxococcota bacterium]
MRGSEDVPLEAVQHGRWSAALVLLSAALCCLHAKHAEAQDVYQESSRSTGPRLKPSSRVVTASISTADVGPISGLVGYGYRAGRFGIGFEVDVGATRDITITRIPTDDGLRIHGRVPLLYRFGDGARFAADLGVAPGVRSLAADDQDAIAVTVDSFFIGHFAVNDGLNLHTGLLLPLAVDLTDDNELASFPGAGWLLGAEFGVSDGFSMLAQGFLGAPEGYGGDGSKSVLEGTIALRWSLDGAPVSGWIQLPSNL